MDNSSTEKNNRQVATWLLIGVLMIIIQVLLGGITRLTESGLSITEWKPITGALPPLNDAAWQIEFEKYRTTDQFKYVHQSFSLSDFKFIFFWEWAHRLWARLMGLVFLAGFIFFLVRKKFNRRMIVPMVILFLLGALQGAIGWLMVKSGLVPEKFFVGHIELTTHFMAALILLGYTLWFAMSLLKGMQQKVYKNSLRNILVGIFILLFFQLVYGGFMAGLRAASTAPTWPDINGQLIPSAFNELSPWMQNLINNKLAVHFIHRGLAYLLLVFVIVFFIRSAKTIGNSIFIKLRIYMLVLIIAQVILGVLTILNATNPGRFVWLGVAHQFTAMLLTICMVGLIFLVRKNKVPAS
jgi:cytochrome c oxidase assembly protein subunit 15